jgi:hypothetical protein
MRYLALIYGEEIDMAAIRTEATRTMMAEYNRFGEDATKAGVLLGGDALQPTSTATTVRVRNNQLLTTDGPFAETKEALGGYYVLDCKDLEQAIEWAARVPGAATGSVEVRPIVEFSQEERAVGTQ